MGLNIARSTMSPTMKIPQSWLDDESKDEYDYPDDIENYKDKGYMWNYDIMQCAGVYDSEGKPIRGGFEDEDVYVMNGFDGAMLDHPGCIVMGWCDG